jgi:hypothetical protein
MQLKRILNNDINLSVISLVVLFFYFTPYFLYGQDVFIRIYDNLDSNVVWLKVLAHSGKIFSDSMEIIPNMMSGLPRLSYGSEFNVELWLYYFFDDFTAYVLNDILIHCFAFFSMVVLLKHYILSEDTPYRNLILYSVSLLFSLIPFWPHAGLSVAAQPLVLWAFLNIRASRWSWREWLVLLLVPFYSSFVLAMFFFLLGMGGILVYDIATKKKVNWSFLGAIIVMTAVYLIVEYRLVVFMLFPSDYVSHREEFKMPLNSLSMMVTQSLNVRFLIGYKNVYALQFDYLLPVILLAFFMVLVQGVVKAVKTINGIWILSGIGIFFLACILGWFDPILTSLWFLPLLSLLLFWSIKYRGAHREFVALILLQVVLSALTVIWFCDCTEAMRTAFPFFERFNMSRIGYLQPLIWYLLLAKALSVLAKSMPFIPVLVAALTLLQSANAFEHRMFIKLEETNFSYRTFYAAEQFKLIRDAIGMNNDSYRVASINIHPVVAVYNGFYSVDGYVANYPLAYKHRFRKVIASYADTRPVMKGLYDNWGSRCYLFSYQVDYNQYHPERKLDKFWVDTNELKKMGVRYIISANEIVNPARLSLEPAGDWEDERWYWHLYLYQVTDEDDGAAKNN